MTPVQVIRLLNDYAVLLPEDTEQKFDPAGQTLEHARDMIEQMLIGQSNGGWMEQKTMRWLGWLQCLLAKHGLRTLEEMRGDNRG